MKYNTFTKKDVVVVLVCTVSLIANIAAIGDNGRKRAKQAVCLSNLMKWGQIFQAYTADNDGYFHARELGSPLGYSRLWIYVYEPYYIDPTMRYCPTATGVTETSSPFGTWNLGFGPWEPDPSYNGSYGLNRCIINMKGAAENDPKYWRRTGVKAAAQVPVLMDCQFFNYWGISDAEPPPYDGAYYNEMQWICINRHEGFINVCFADFSARKVGLKELWTLKHSRTYDTCDIWTICGWGGNQQHCASAWDEQSPWMKDFPEY